VTDAPAIESQVWPIERIRIGTRHRRDMGDIDGLAADIEEIGLLHPVPVTPEGVLIAGRRRLLACEKLGWPEVPVTVVPLKEIARGEWAENAVRKDFTLSEAVAIWRSLEPELRAAARERQGTRTDLLPAKLAESERGDSRDKAARFTGFGRTSMEKAKAIVAAAEQEPAKFGSLRKDMDRTGHVNVPYRRLLVMRQAEAIRKEPPPLPGRGPYRVIVADPPWPAEVRMEDPSHRAAAPYPTQSIADICALPVASIAHSDSILWLWTTNFFMRSAFAVLDSWHFEHKTIATWAKPRATFGDWLRGQTEHCLMAVRGKPIVHLTNQTTLLQAPMRGHSRKPAEFYAFVESLCPAPRYASLYHRGPLRPNWDGHGDEIRI
jgi:N6-adenosine-specific RNA methylase IME4